MNVASANSLEALQRQQTQEAGAVVSRARETQGAAPRQDRPSDTVELSAEAKQAAQAAPTAEETPDTDRDQDTRPSSNQAQARAEQRTENQATSDPAARSEADKAYTRSQQDVTQQVVAPQDAAARQQAALLNLYA